MKRLLANMLFIGTTMLLLFTGSCSKSSPAMGNLNPGGTNTGGNNNTGTGSDTASIVATWQLDTLIVENIDNPAPLHNDSAIIQHSDTQVFTTDSVHTDSWIVIINDPSTQAISVTERSEYTIHSKFIKQGSKLIFYENGGVDTASIIKLTDHELAYRTPVPASLHFHYTSIYQHYKK